MDDLERLRNRLEYFLSMTEVSPDGLIIERRELVARIYDLKIIIHPNEHAPPHFHVESDNINASFEILTGELLRGNIGGKDLRRIEAFHNSAKELLINTWNRLRPTDCPVGPIKINEDDRDL